MITDWDDAYANGAHIEGADGYPPRWSDAAAAFRASLGPRAELDMPYGEGERQRFDLFYPEGAPKGLAIFVHGGYWMAFDKSAWSHLAAGGVAAGWAVALPSYTLTPAARITQITEEIGTAVETIATRIDGPIRLAGHSAGGHLVSRMVCQDAPVHAGIQDRIAHVLSISGVHDLRPLRRTRMNDTLRLDGAEAISESPALLAPVDGSRLTAWVGASERPEFIRQTELLANVWTGLGAETRVVRDPERHHFNVIDGLADAGHALCRAFTGDDGFAG